MKKLWSLVLLAGCATADPKAPEPKEPPALEKKEPPAPNPSPAAPKR